MGFWSSLWSGISKVCSPIINAVSSVLQNSPLMQKLMPVLMAVIPPPLDAIAFVALEAISAAMGKPENPDELGWQMNEADKKPEDFDSFEEYREYLDEEYPFDKEAFDAQTDEQKSACRYIGMAGTMEELRTAKDGLEFNPATLGVLAGAATSLRWDPATLKSFTEGLMTSLNGAGVSINSLGDFAKGNLGAGETGKFEQAVEEGTKMAGVGDSSSAVTDAMANSTENL